MQRLKNKVVLITGAAQGIGKACAELFCQEGAKVILTDINDQEGMIVASALGPMASYQHLDVQSEKDWSRVFENANESGMPIDVLINNAGITGFQEGFGPQDPEHASLESFRKVHAVNLEGVFLGCRLAIQHMKRHSGSIVNISSRSGMVGIPGAAAYASSKAAVRNHTKTVALYCCEKGYAIRCNSLHPAAIYTPLWEPMLGTGDARQAMLQSITQSIPMGHIGEPMDVAYAALYLASEESKYLTGTEITIDGGILAGSSASPKKETVE